jgi:hypothetical protein
MSAAGSSGQLLRERKRNPESGVRKAVPLGKRANISGRQQWLSGQNSLFAVDSRGEESVVPAGANSSDRKRRIAVFRCVRCLTKYRIYRKFDVCFPEVKQSA